MTSQPTNLSPQQQALQAIASFERSPAPSVWPYLDKAQVIADIKARVNDPFQINQGQQPFCGPASILFELVRKQPLRYVKLCQSLFQVGGFHGNTKFIEASERLRQSQGRLRMGMADWMILSTWRDNENLIFSVEPDAPDVIRNLAGMTKSWEMKGWVAEILGYKNVKYYHTYIYGETEALQEAKNAIAAGGVAFALITAEGLLQNKPPLLPFPSHWITILGNIAINKGTPGQPHSGRFAFDIYTWARKMRIDAQEEILEKYFWGIVMGWN